MPKAALHIKAHKKVRRKDKAEAMLKTRNRTIWTKTDIAVGLLGVKSIMK